jgi:hypothetical protein
MLPDLLLSFDLSVEFGEAGMAISQPCVTTAKLSR